MPCNCDHLEPSVKEKESKKVLRFLKETGWKIPDTPAYKEYKKYKYYGNVSTLDQDTAALCEWCQQNPKKVKEMSLELQIWWRDHQEADKRKAEHKAAVAKQKKLKAEALAKLTPAERKALGL